MREVEAGKKKYRYTKQVDPGRLMAEFYAKIPELAPKFTEEGVEVHLRVFTNSDGLILWVDEDVAEEEIEQIVDAHTLEEEGEIDAISSNTK